MTRLQRPVCYHLGCFLLGTYECLSFTLSSSRGRAATRSRLLSMVCTSVQVCPTHAVVRPILRPRGWRCGHFVVAGEPGGRQPPLFVAVVFLTYIQQDETSRLQTRDTCLLSLESTRFFFEFQTSCSLVPSPLRRSEYQYHTGTS